MAEELAGNPTLDLERYPVTVLLVDDQRLIGEAVRRLLASEADIDFHFCEDPREALRRAKGEMQKIIEKWRKK